MENKTPSRILPFLICTLSRLAQLHSDFRCFFTHALTIYAIRAPVDDVPFRQLTLFLVLSLFSLCFQF